MVMEANEEDARPASSFDKDEKDAITSSGNNGDRLLEKQKPKSVVWRFLVINPILMESLWMKVSLFVRFVVLGGSKRWQHK